MLTDDTQSVKPASFKQTINAYIDEFESELVLSKKVLSNQYKLTIITDDGVEFGLPENTQKEIQDRLKTHYTNIVDKAKASLMLKISDALFYQNYETVE